MVKIRVRQHVNPLGQKYQIAMKPPQWSNIYLNLNLPIHLDIGSAKGQFLLEMAQLEANMNFLGVEIREPLVKEANRIRDELGLTNLSYIFANINTSLTVLLSSLPPKSLQRVTIQFPDPWFKNRHAKRRVVDGNLVNILAQYLVDGGIVFLQSDVQEVAQQMKSFFQLHPLFQLQHQEFWLADNPFPFSTEREKYTSDRHLPIYRCLFHKISE